MNAASSLRTISLPMHYFVARPGTHKKNFLLFVCNIFSILFFSLKFQLRGCDCQDKKQNKTKKKTRGKFSSVIVLLEHFLVIIIINISPPCFHYSIEFSMICLSFSLHLRMRRSTSKFACSHVFSRYWSTSLLDHTHS